MFLKFTEEEADLKYKVAKETAGKEYINALNEEKK